MGSFSLAETAGKDSRKLKRKLIFTAWLTFFSNDPLAASSADASNPGYALNSQRRFDEPIVCIQKALEINPNMVETHYTLGFA